MEKCLVTKLNGIVNNNSLLALDEFRYKLRGKKGKTSTMYFYNSFPTKVKSDIPININGKVLTETTVEANHIVSMSLVNDNDIATISLFNKSHQIDRWE